MPHEKIQQPGANKMTLEEYQEIIGRKGFVLESWERIPVEQGQYSITFEHIGKTLVFRKPLSIAQLSVAVKEISPSQESRVEKASDYLIT